MSKQFLILLFAFLITLSDCQRRFLDESNQANLIPLIPAETGYAIGSPTWLSDDIIVFSYVSIAEFNNLDHSIPDLRLYDIEQKKWKRIPVENKNDCQILNFSSLQRLPNHQLGFYNTCLSENGSTKSVIQEMNILTGELNTLLDADFTISPGQFSFSPDMSELIQEDETGRFLSNKLFYKHGDITTQIVPNFTRAMYPHWSLIEREIAFWGTESYPGGNQEDLMTSQEISALALYPFDMYVSSPEGTNLKKVVSSVKDPMLLKWSPTGRTVAFAGTIDNYSGIWLVNPSTSEVIRIWASSGDFDWSPDGSKIVIVSNQKDEAGKITKQEINIISVRS